MMRTRLCAYVGNLELWEYSSNGVIRYVIVNKKTGEQRPEMFSNFDFAEKVMLSIYKLGH